MPGCLRCDPILHTGYDPYKPWPPGWGGTTPPGSIYPLDALAIFSVAPNSAPCLSAALTSTATGQNFTATTEILLDGVTPLSVANGRATFVSPTSMTFTIDPVPETTPRTAQITCRDTAGYGAGLGAAPFNFTPPAILSVTCPLVPASAMVSTPALTVTVNGTLFTAASIVMLDGADQVTDTSGAPTQLKFQLTPGAAATTHTISVKDGATTAVTTCPFQITLTPLLTVVCPVVPATAVGGTADLQVTVNGTNFTPATVATIGGVDAVTTPPVGTTSLTFTLPVSTYSTAQTLQIGARDGANTAAVTCPFTITVTTLMPTITSVVPDYLGDSDPPKTITVTGTNFDATSVIVKDTDDMPTTFVNATTLTYQTSGPPQTTGSAPIYVRNGTTTSPTSILFNCVTNPTINAINPVSAPIGSAALEVQIAGAALADTAEVLMDGVGVPTRWTAGQVFATLNPAVETAPRTVQLTVRLGHQHGAIHDDVGPIPPKSVPFNFV